MTIESIRRQKMVSVPVILQFFVEVQAMGKNMLFVLSTAMVASVFFQTTASASDYKWSDNGDGTCTIIRYIGSGGNVIIPDTLDSLTVISIGNRSRASGFYDCNTITSITIPDSLTKIGDGAFGDCPSLAEIAVARTNPVYKSVDGVLFDKAITKLIQYPRGKTGTYTIPDSVTSIENEAFADCTGLTSLTILESVRDIGGDAFLDLGPAVFSGCSNLAEITVAPTNPVYKSVDGVLFDKALTKLIQYPRGETGTYTIPDSVTSIENEAFADCTGLTSLTIPESVRDIGHFAFAGCTGLKNVTIPRSITDIDRFGDSPILTEITVDPNNPTYKSIDGVLFDKALTKLIQYPRGKTGAYAIPDTVTSIGAYAFAHCDNLTGISIPNSIITIGDFAFVGCTGLTSVKIPESVTDIGRMAFSKCTAITSIKIPDNITAIGYWAFMGCSDLDSITMPNSVTLIGNGAFMGCTGLKNIYFKGNPPVLGFGVFQDVNQATVYYLPDSVGWDATFGGLPTAVLRKN